MKPGAPALPSLCSPNALGTSECEYAVYGKFNILYVDYDCCAHGYSDPDVDAALVPEQYCDTAPLHSAYR